MAGRGLYGRHCRWMPAALRFWEGVKMLILLFGFVLQGLQLLGATPTTLPLGEVGVIGTVLRNEYDQYRIVVTDIPALLRLDLDVTGGDCDLFVSDGINVPTKTDYVWKSDSLMFRGDEYVLAMAARPAVFYASVFGFDVCTYTLTAQTFAYNVVTLTNAQAKDATVKSGLYSFFKLTLPADTQFYAVDLAFTNFNTMNDITMLVSTTESMVLKELRRGVIPDRLELRATKGTTARRMLYHAGGDDYYLGVFADLQVYSETDMRSFSVKMSYSNVVTECMASGSIRQSQVYPGQLQFFAIPRPASGHMLRVEVTTTLGEVHLFSSQRYTHPLNAEQSTITRSSCAFCAVEFPWDPGVRPETTGYSCAPGASAGGEVYFAVYGYAATRASTFLLTAWDVPEHCAWRPSCRSCQELGDECTWCSRDGGYCDGASTALASPSECKPVVTCPREGTSTADPCYALDSCEQCASTAGADCGWCTYRGAGSVCAAGTQDGADKGYCSKWLFSALAGECEDVCSVHSGGSDLDAICGGCLSEPSCGLCFSGGRLECVSGTKSGPALPGTCDDVGDAWVVTLAECLRINRTPSWTQPVTLGSSVTETYVVMGEFAQGAVQLTCVRNTPDAEARNVHTAPVVACPASAYAASLGTSLQGGMDVVAWLDVTPQSVRGLVARASISGVPVPGTELAGEVWSALEVAVSGNTRSLVFLTGLCDLPDSARLFYYIAFDVYQEEANERVDASISFQPRRVPGTMTLRGPGSTVRFAGPDQFLCCYQTRHFVLEGLDADGSPLAAPLTMRLRVTAGLGPGANPRLPDDLLTGLQVYVREGACAQASAFDKWAHGSNASFLLPTSTNAVPWLVSVVAVPGGALDGRQVFLMLDAGGWHNSTGTRVVKHVVAAPEHTCQVFLMLSVFSNAGVRSACVPWQRYIKVCSIASVQSPTALGYIQHRLSPPSLPTPLSSPPPPPYVCRVRERDRRIRAGPLDHRGLPEPDYLPGMGDQACR
eukprot:jgi/Mesvir1/24513/Mv21857-RA.2